MLYPDGSGVVVRTPRSGGWGGEKVLSGDLIPVFQDRIDYRFPFFWEVKTVKRDAVSAFRLLGGDGNILSRWLKKAESQALENYLPILLWKVDFGRWFAYMDKGTYEQLRDAFGGLPRGCTTLEASDELEGFVNMKVEDLRRWFKSKVFTEVVGGARE